jgi:hypothetical protein
LDQKAVLHCKASIQIHGSCLKLFGKMGQACGKTSLKDGGSLHPQEVQQSVADAQVVQVVGSWRVPSAPPGRPPLSPDHQPGKKEKKNRKKKEKEKKGFRGVSCIYEPGSRDIARFSTLLFFT